MRANGVGSLAVSCSICNHVSVASGDPWPDRSAKAMRLSAGLGVGARAASIKRASSGLPCSCPDRVTSLANGTQPGCNGDDDASATALARRAAAHCNSPRRAARVGGYLRRRRRHHHGRYSAREFASWGLTRPSLAATPTAGSSGCSPHGPRRGCEATIAASYERRRGRA